MGKRRNCDVSTRALIVHMFKEGKSYSDIATLVNCSKKKVYTAVQHYKKHNTTENVSRKKKARKTSSREDALIIREAKKFPHKTAREIRVEIFGVAESAPSVDTVKRRLREAGLPSRVARKKPLLSSNNRKKRLEFARRYRDWTVQQWKNVLFSDETKINRVSSDGRRYVRRPKNQPFNPKYTIPTLKHGGGSIMVWGSMSWKGPGAIHWVKERMDRFVYTNILENVMLPYAEENLSVLWTYQQDNDPKHTAAYTKKWFQDNYVTVLDWPSCSPDLNPIEHMWGYIKRKVGSEKIDNFADLYEKIQQIWYSTPKSFCEKLITSMPRRLEEVIKNNGYATKY